MELDHILKQLMGEVDEKLEIGANINKKGLIEEHVEDPIEKKICNSFLEHYINLKETYLKKKSYLTSSNEQEINYRKIGANAFWGGLVASNTISNIAITLIGAIIGGSMTFYNQKKNANMDLSKLFWWSIVGRTIGSYLDPKNSDVYSTLGAAFGCGLATLTELKKVGTNLTPEEKMIKLQQLELPLYQDVQLLIHDTRIEYSNKMCPNIVE